MPLNPDRAGQAIALTVMTPIRPGAQDELGEYLDGLHERGSPLAKLPRTHFARWVIVPSFVRDPAQPKDDPLGCRYLLFTSNLDGPLDSYLDELCERLVPEAEEIWGRCVGCPQPASGGALKAYLLHNRLRTGQFVAAYPNATVAAVRDGLDLRERVIAFAVHAQGMAPADLQRAFREAF
jgi:hypothetical protein